MIYIISDITRFKDSEDVCIAILGREDGICRRPLPYKNRTDVSEIGIMPGTLFKAELTPRSDLSGPHSEDCDFSNEEWQGLVEESELRALMAKTSFDSLTKGFDEKVNPKIRCVEVDACPGNSIITVKVVPGEVSFSFVDTDDKKMRLNLTDCSGVKYRRLPVADLYFHTLAHELLIQGRLDALTERIANSREVYIRIGLGRFHESRSGKKGYWLQVNGIYFFPGYYDLMGFNK